MKFLLTALTGLSFAGGTAAPLISQSTTNHQSVSPQDSVTIDLGENVKISTDQGGKLWSLEFSCYLTNLINQVSFGGEGLNAYIGWGGDSWSHTYDTINVNVTNDENTSYHIFDDQHTDFLARQSAYLRYNLAKTGTYSYKFTLNFFTKSYNSFNGCWGTLTIGDSLTFSN